MARQTCLKAAILCWGFLIATALAANGQTIVTLTEAPRFDRRVILIDPHALHTHRDLVLQSVSDLIDDPSNTAGETRIALASGRASAYNATGATFDEVTRRILRMAKRSEKPAKVPDLFEVQTKLRTMIPKNVTRLHLVWIGGAWSAGDQLPDPFNKKIDWACVKQVNGSAIDKVGEVEIDIHPIGNGPLPPNQAAEVLSSIFFADGAVRFLRYVGPGCTTSDWAKVGVAASPLQSADPATCEPRSYLQPDDLPSEEQNRQMPICNRFASITVASSAWSETSLLYVTEVATSAYDVSVVLRPEKGQDYRAQPGPNDATIWQRRAPGRVEVILSIKPKSNCKELQQYGAAIKLAAGASYFRDARRLDISVSGLHCDSELRTPYLIHATQWELL